MLNLDLWGISFHAAVVFGLGKDFLSKSALGHCVVSINVGQALVSSFIIFLGKGSKNVIYYKELCSGFYTFISCNFFVQQY